MALRAVVLRSGGVVGGSHRFSPGLRRSAHAMALPPMTDAPIAPSPVVSPTYVLPEFDGNPGRDGVGFPSFSGDASMELMAVPKRKTTPHKRGIRNGPKALKPVPVIIRCKSCGRVKLPHFYCCSGDRGQANEQSGAN